MMAITEDLLPADFYENGYSTIHVIGGYGPYYDLSPMAYVVVDTDARYMFIKGYSNQTGYPQYAHIGIQVNGVNSVVDMSVTVGGWAWSQVDLGVAPTKVVRITSGLQLVTIAHAWQGVYPRCLYIAGGTYVTPRVPAAVNRLVIYGDSKEVGQAATYPTSQGLVPVLRTLIPTRSVMCEAWGRRSLYDDCPDAAGRTAFAARLAGYNPTAIWLAIGSNDFGLSEWSAANFGTAYADLMDKINAAAPAAWVYCQTPIYRTDEAVANGFGNVLADYRAQIVTAQSTRAAFSSLVDGTGAEFPGAADLADGIHPTTAGQAKYAAAIQANL